jgi:hypothetical protein
MYQYLKDTPTLQAANVGQSIAVIHGKVPEDHVENIHYSDVYAHIVDISRGAREKFALFFTESPDFNAQLSVSTGDQISAAPLDVTFSTLETGTHEPTLDQAIKNAKDQLRAMNLEVVES